MDVECGEVSFYGFRVERTADSGLSVDPATHKAMVRDVGSGMVYPTEAQVLALARLVPDAAGREATAKRGSYDCLGWRPGQNATFMVGVFGMVVGIEPDGYTHS